MNLNKIAIVFNPKGGSASESKVNEIALLFQDRDIKVVSCATSPEPGSATKLASSAAGDGAELVIAFGGDGTACQVAEGLKDSSVPMAVFPGGTGNLFARSFYANPSPQRFVQMILNGRPQPVDMVSARYKDLSGKDHSRLFMVGFGLGKLSDAISTASPFWKRYFKQVVYVVNVALACLWPNAQRFHLRTPDTESSGDVAALFALNVAPPAMAKMSRGCNASDGLIDVVIFQLKSFWQVIPLLLLLGIGRPEWSKHYSRLRTNELTVKCDKSMLPNIDGDPGEPTKEITLKAEPGVVRMIVS